MVDPRRIGCFKKRPFRIELYEVKYEVRGMILFTTTSMTLWVLAVRREFYRPPSPYVNVGYHRLIINTKGTDPETLFCTRPILVFEPQTDKDAGEALGIIFVKYGRHAKAARCVNREHGRKLGPANHWDPTLVAKMPRSKWYLMASARASVRYYADLKNAGS